MIHAHQPQERHTPPWQFSNHLMSAVYLSFIEREHDQPMTATAAVYENMLYVRIPTPHEKAARKVQSKITNTQHETRRTSTNRKRPACSCHLHSTRGGPDKTPTNHVREMGSHCHRHAHLASSRESMVCLLCGCTQTIGHLTQINIPSFEFLLLVCMHTYFGGTLLLDHVILRSATVVHAACSPPLVKPACVDGFHNPPLHTESMIVNYRFASHRTKRDRERAPPPPDCLSETTATGAWSRRVVKP